MGIIKWDINAYRSYLLSMASFSKGNGSDRYISGYVDGFQAALETLDVYVLGLKPNATKEEEKNDI
jgi:hypothetical protein